MTRAALRGKWRDQVFRDRHLTPATFKTGYAMGHYMLMTGGDTEREYKRRGKLIIYPSQGELAEKASLAEDTVRVSIGQLIERGHIKLVHRGNQFSGPNRYQVIVFDQEATRKIPGCSPRKFRDARRGNSGSNSY